MLTSSLSIINLKIENLKMKLMTSMMLCNKVCQKFVHLVDNKHVHTIVLPFGAIITSLHLHGGFGAADLVFLTLLTAFNLCCNDKRDFCYQFLNMN